MARHDYSLDYYVGREMEWRREFIAAHPERDYLFIDNNSIIWITHKVSGTPMQQANQKKDIIAFNLRNRIFSAIYEGRFVGHLGPAGEPAGLERIAEGVGFD